MSDNEFLNHLDYNSGHGESSNITEFALAALKAAGINGIPLTQPDNIKGLDFEFNGVPYHNVKIDFSDYKSVYNENPSQYEFQAGIYMENGDRVFVTDSNRNGTIDMASAHGSSDSFDYHILFDNLESSKEGAFNHVVLHKQPTDPFSVFVTKDTGKTISILDNDGTPGYDIPIPEKDSLIPKTFGVDHFDYFLDVNKGVKGIFDIVDGASGN